ncbi:MAG: YlxR family protein [Armatimonadota bacterium]|nr:YlxR family protein [Armatimonadota bacterium]
MRQRKIPIRTCVACRTSGEKKSLIRIVRTSEGRVVIDATGKLPGRGAYVCPSVNCLNKAIKEKRLSRALRIEVPEEVIQEAKQIVSQGSEEM